MKKKMYTVFIIQCYSQKTEDGRLIDNVIVQAVADNEKDAMAKAKKYVTKPFYRLSEVIENFI